MIFGRTFLAKDENTDQYVLRLGADRQYMPTLRFSEADYQRLGPQRVKKILQKFEEQIGPILVPDET